MSGTRFGVLLFGPALMVAGLYWLVYGIPKTGAATVAHEAPQSVVGALTEEQSASLKSACDSQAEKLRSEFGPETTVAVHQPYVYAGNVPSQRIERLHKNLVQPMTRMLQTCYLDRKPLEPITILVFADQTSFQAHSEKAGRSGMGCYSGYYLREQRRIIVNLATGTGTLAHELTHSLSHVDCPNLPEWFDEGFASLHEEGDFTRDRLAFHGRSNWRLHYLREALQRGDLPSTETLMTQKEFRGGGEAVAYAQSRYFCLYLQQRGLLAHYYRKLRASIDRDPTGVTALKELLHVDSLDGFDREFQAWVRKQGGLLSRGR